MSSSRPQREGRAAICRERRLWTKTGLASPWRESETGYGRVAGNRFGSCVAEGVGDEGRRPFWQTGLCPAIREASMSRILSCMFAALACGGVSWAAVGSIAAAIGNARNSREGAAAMGGFFIIGGLA